MMQIKYYTWLVLAFLISILHYHCTEPMPIFKTDNGTEEDVSGKRIFETDLISTSNYERDLTISPDGDELYYTSVSPKNKFSTLIRLRKQNGIWGNKEIASFSGKYSDLEPAFDPQGNRLFFASNRPVNMDGQIKDYDIWFVEKMENQEWSNAQRLDTIINSSANEFYPSIANNGNLYFTASYPDAKGKEDIYKSIWNGKYFEKAVSLDSVNTKYFEFNAYISPDESFLIYSSFDRPDGLGRGDLYISFQETGIWQHGINLGESINSAFLDFCPFVDIEENKLYFTSEKNNIQDIQEEKLNLEEWDLLLSDPMNGNANIFVIPFDLESYR